MKSTVQNSNIKQGEYRTLISGPFYKCELYNDAGEVVLSQWLEQPQNLDNSTQELDCMPFQQGDEGMATKINRVITIDGVKHWIHANTEQEYADKLMKLIDHNPQETGKHLFSDYAWSWYETYSKPNIDTATKILYSGLLKRYLIPAFGETAVEDIALDDMQKMFNSMETSKETKMKAKRLLNQILNAAVDDGFLSKNLAKSKRLKIAGAESKETEPYTVEQMQYLVQHIPDIKQEQDRIYMALHTLHPLRLEEVLGLKWADIDLDNRILYVRRAVTHPDRNKPEIKETKTKSSVRPLQLSAIAAQYLKPGKPEDFILGGETPLSYSIVRRMRERIQREIGFRERITPMRFRTTVLSDHYYLTHDIKLTQAAAGHTTAEMTLKHYVKGRGNIAYAADIIDSVYGGTQQENLQKNCKSQSPETADTKGMQGGQQA